MNTIQKFGIVHDFDGTVAETFKPSPSGLGVKEAYENSVECIFGPSALDYYKRTGGLQNRAPREVVDSLFNAGFWVGCGQDEATEQLVNRKIDCLLKHAFGQPLSDGTPWPRLTLGFASYWQWTSARMDTFTVILSSGHEVCIRKTFEMHNLPQPDLIVTDDEFRRLPEPLCKPDPRLWQYMLAKVDVSFRRTVYIGDDHVKDGELAKNAGVPFLHFAPKGAEYHGRNGTFDDWGSISLEA